MIEESDVTKILGGLHLSKKFEHAYEAYSLPVSRVPSYQGGETPTRMSSHSSRVSDHMRSPVLVQADHSDPPSYSGSKADDSGDDILMMKTKPGTAPAYTPNKDSNVDRKTKDVELNEKESSLIDYKDSKDDWTDQGSERSAPSIKNLQADPNDPYRRSLRPAPTMDPEKIKPQFIFKKLPHTNSNLGAHFGISGHHGSNHSSSQPHPAKGHHSFSGIELKRFFKGSNERHHRSGDKDNSPGYTTPPRKSTSSRKVSAVPSHSSTKSMLPFGDDHAGLSRKYGRFGKVLGSGAGGSVRIMKRASDGKIFAVKEFRARNPGESERDYAKKVTAEFCVGSTLHHPNVIEALDIIREDNKFYEVMEYAPFDLFATVMTGKMSREEIYCCFKQILSGVQYLHDLGLAHRDLKLDNCVIDGNGIVKIIDFGSATVFRYPFEHDVVLAHGVVGSDPYLSPEVLQHKEYDPRPTDIWSVGIIFCCMILRRFPWKLPNTSDPSFKHFIAADNSHKLTPEILARTETETLTIRKHTEKQSNEKGENPQFTDKHTDHHHHDKHDNNNNNRYENQHDAHHHSEPKEDKPTKTTSASSHSSSGKPSAPPAIIKGPWRVLRLIPRESRFLILQMLELDPQKRISADGVLESEFARSIEMCAVVNGTVVHAKNHEHLLVNADGQEEKVN